MSDIKKALSLLCAAINRIRDDQVTLDRKANEIRADANKAKELLERLSAGAGIGFAEVDARPQPTYGVKIPREAELTSMREAVRWWMDTNTPSGLCPAWVFQMRQILRTEGRDVTNKGVKA